MNRLTIFVYKHEPKLYGGEIETTPLISVSLQQFSALSCHGAAHLNVKSSFSQVTKHTGPLLFDHITLITLVL